jgi:hypothetical protein
MGSVTYYRDSNLGLELQGDVQTTTLNDGSSGVAIGPVYRFTKPLSPTVHAAIGAQHFYGPIVPSANVPGGTTFYANGPNWATTASVGGSVDIPVPGTRGFVAVRLEAWYQYFHASYGPIITVNSGGQVNLNAYQLNPGLVFRFGHASPVSPRRKH